MLEVLRTEGVRHVFGNPGSTELPFIDALAAALDLHYVLALQEATAVAMAEGYAQATRRAAFLNLHTSAGLGNAIGNLTNARANGTPLVVTAGQQHYAHIAQDPLLSGPLVELATGTVKWAHEVRTVDELGTILRRAFHDAASAPTGPVFVSLPMNLLDEQTDEPVPAPSTIVRDAVAGAIDELAGLVTEPPLGRLALVVGDEVAAAGGVEAAVRLAETLGCPVYGSPLFARGVFPPSHPLWRGMLSPSADAIARALEPFERVLLIGGQAFMVYPYTQGPALPAHVELLHLSPDAHQLGRAWPVRLGAVGDPRASIEALVECVASKVDARAVADALSNAGTARHAEIERLETSARERYGPAPMHPMAAAHALVRAVPDETPIVDEAITTGVYVRGFHHWRQPGRYFFCRGGGLGWGMPAAVGVSLGLDRAPVLCVVGDGSAMYSPQALWTAAHESLPVLFAVVNNRQYLILKGYLEGMGGDAARTGNLVGMDLDEPPVDFIALSRSMGVDATLIESADDIADAVHAALASRKPHLLELPISVK
jgi:benzoylformate decarboxylase